MLFRSIALAVALQVRCIAADEPTSALDVTVQAEILRLLDELRRERTMAVLLVSHDLALVSTLADHIVVIEQGRIQEEGTHQELTKLGGRYANLFELQAKGYA